MGHQGSGLLKRNGCLQLKGGLGWVKLTRGGLVALPTEREKVVYRVKHVCEIDTYYFPGSSSPCVFFFLLVHLNLFQM